ncbi:DegT/DnrJ/EryC1/StrS family aminotransferase [Enterococcus sp. AZ109]|uniref:DegT/DnrJ/EryC1/StrS family aminotransferase n=1 Tax=Enterococcus sp. AZ109 TaxID=2774634 RepID=UPI003F255630
MKDIYVTRASMPSLEEYVEEIKDIWDTHWMTNSGIKSLMLEEELKKLLQADQLSLFVNGHLALELLVQAMNLSGEVITTPYTFASTTHAIVRNNLTPVFCDIKPDDFTMDADKIEALITDKTTAILPVHVYGNVCEVEKIQKIADAYDLKVIYDAAHVFGVTYKGDSISKYGDASMYSFHATKVFNTIEGGCACYKDEKVGYKLEQLKNFGIQCQTVVDGVGANAKMNEFQAAMGLCNMKYLQKNIQHRQKIVELYNDLLGDVEGITLNKIQEDVQSNFSYYPIVVYPEYYGATRNQLANFLDEQGIHPRKYFYPITSSFDCYHNQFDPFQTPVALKMSKRVLTLPLYADLSLQDVERICQLIKQFGKSMRAGSSNKITIDNSI